MTRKERIKTYLTGFLLGVLLLIVWSSVRHQMRNTPRAPQQQQQLDENPRQVPSEAQETPQNPDASTPGDLPEEGGELAP